MHGNKNTNEGVFDVDDTKEFKVVVIVAVKVRNVDIGDVLDQCVNEKKRLAERG